MTRVIHGPKDRVIPFDLRNKTRMVDAVLFAYYYGRLRKKIFDPKKFFETFFEKFFFRSFMVKINIKHRRFRH